MITMSLQWKVFWKLPEDAKDVFYGEVLRKLQQTIETEVPTKVKSVQLPSTATIYKLIIRDTWHNICRKFYTKTLNISRFHIECVHKRRAQHTGIPAPAQPFNRKSYSDDTVAGVRMHIESFLKVNHITAGPTLKSNISSRIYPSPKCINVLCATSRIRQASCGRMEVLRYL